jgi:serine protease inhibitor
MHGDSTHDEAEDSNHTRSFRLSLHPVPSWHVSRQNYCIHAILNALPHNENVVLSPFSLISCMAMLCRGATKGPARDQLAYYCWPCAADSTACDDAAALSALSAFVSQLTGVEVCRYANILMSDHVNVKEYKDDILKHFKAKPYGLHKFEKVNDLVQEITTIPKKVLSRKPDGTVLINAVYFADKWTYKFDPQLLERTPFTQPTGLTVNVDMMNQKNRLSVAQFNSVTAVHLDYMTPGLGAWFVKHDTQYTHEAAYEALQTFLQHEFVSHTLPKSTKHVDLTVPKFTMSSSIDLLKLFSQTTGHKITDVFQPAGNLSRMTNATNECVTRFDQECILEVDQKGTVAAAVTTSGATRGGSGGGPQYNYISFKHTFYMVIHHNDTILFVAKVASPTPSPPAAQLVLPPTQAPLQSPEVTINVPVNKIVPRTLRVEVRQYVEESAESSFDIPSHFDTIDETTIPIRVYEVQPKTKDNEQLIRVIVTLKGEPDEPNDTFITLWVIYITEYGEDDSEKKLISLKINDPYELPFPIQKYEGEGDDGWDLRDEKDNTFLKIRFRVPDS